MEREYVVRMQDEVRDWVREYLGYDAATNHPRLQEATHWHVVEFQASEGMITEVIPGTESERFGDEGFVLGEDYDFYQTVGHLVVEGFPMQDYI